MNRPDKEADAQSALVGADKGFAEAFRGLSSQSIEETVTLLASVIESTPSAVFAKNLDGRYVLINSTASKLLSWPRTEVLGQTDDALFPREIAETYVDGDRAVIESGQMLVYEEECEPFESGEWRFRLVTKGPIRDSDGKIVGVMGIARDITEEKETERVLANLARESGLLATYGMQLMSCKTDEEVFALIEAFGREVLSDSVVLVNQSDPDGKHAVLRAVQGLGREELLAAARQLGFEFLGRRFPVSDEFRKRYSDATLTLIEGGFPTLAGDQIPKSVAKTVAKVLGFHDVYTVAISDETHDYGSMHIITKAAEVRLPALLVDAFVRQCFLALSVIDRAHNLELAFSSVIDVVSRTVEMRDPYTAGHQRRVTALATAIARECGMSAEEVDDIRVAALMHDVGKISIPAEVLSKPGLLSPMEYELVKLHAEAGYEIVQAARMRDPIAELIYQHHERGDGSGYPRGLAEDELLPGAKVLMVADVVEAMVSHRPYRPSIGVGPAITEITSNAGRLYDAEVVAACVRVLEGGFDFDAEDLAGRQEPPPRRSKE